MAETKTKTKTKVTKPEKEKTEHEYIDENMFGIEGITIAVTDDMKASVDKVIREFPDNKTIILDFEEAEKDSLVFSQKLLKLGWITDKYGENVQEYLRDGKVLRFGLKVKINGIVYPDAVKMALRNLFAYLKTNKLEPTVFVIQQSKKEFSNDEFTKIYLALYQEYVAYREENTQAQIMILLYEEEEKYLPLTGNLSDFTVKKKKNKKKKKK